MFLSSAYTSTALDSSISFYYSLPLSSCLQYISSFVVYPSWIVSFHLLLSFPSFSFFFCLFPRPDSWREIRNNPHAHGNTHVALENTFHYSHFVPLCMRCARNGNLRTLLFSNNKLPQNSKKCGRISVIRDFLISFIDPTFATLSNIPTAFFYGCDTVGGSLISAFFAEKSIRLE